MEKDIQQIWRMLPHRYPFLMVDRIVEVSAEEVTAIKNVTINEPFFPGHFPEQPIMPGVLIVEALAQTGGILAHSLTLDEKPDAVYLMGLDKVRFRKPVVPGDQLLLKLSLLRRKGMVFKMKGEALVAGELVAEAEIMATVATGKAKSDEPAA